MTTRRALAALIVLLVMVGCSPLRSDQPPAQQYVLTSVSGAGAAAEPVRLPGPLTLERPTVAPGLDGTRIRVRRSGHRLDHIADARWAEPLPMVVAARLRSILARAPRAGDDQPAEAAPDHLHVRLERFYPVYSADTDDPPELQVVLAVRLVSAGDGHTLASARARNSAAASANRVDAIVEGLSDLLEQTFLDALAQVRTELEDD